MHLINDAMAEIPTKTFGVTAKKRKPPGTVDRPLHDDRRTIDAATAQGGK